MWAGRVEDVCVGIVEVVSGDGLRGLWVLCESGWCVGNMGMV